jgi:hypothetical protein
MLWSCTTELATGMDEAIPTKFERFPRMRLPDSAEGQQFSDSPDILNILRRKQLKLTLFNVH